MTQAEIACETVQMRRNVYQMNDMMEGGTTRSSLPRNLLSCVLARGPDPLAVVPEEPRCGAPDGDGDCGEDRVALAIPECFVHCGREEWEAEACTRTQECDGGERGGGM